MSILKEQNVIKQHKMSWLIENKHHISLMLLVNAAKHPMFHYHSPKACNKQQRTTKRIEDKNAPEVSR